MPIIKRYPNRKLYNTETKQYITLEGVADLIRQGQEVEVVDHTTGEDLTALTLTQIILDQQKKKGGFLPGNLLSGLVKAGGVTVSALQHSLASPMGFWTQVNEEIARRIDALISRGELSLEDGAHLREKLMGQGDVSGGALHPTEAELEQALAERGVPTRDDIQRLMEQIETLSAQLDQLKRREQPASPIRPRTRRKGQ
jgi:polyhydroxyalkanoate synthesis repressor PhaR